MPLTADERRILAMLATAGLNGVTRPLPIALGFGVPLIAGLVNLRSSAAGSRRLSMQRFGPTGKRASAQQARRGRDGAGHRKRRGCTCPNEIESFDPMASKNNLRPKIESSTL
jgi:hypothetical protein